MFLTLCSLDFYLVTRVIHAHHQPFFSVCLFLAVTYTYFLNYIFGNEVFSPCNKGKTTIAVTHRRKLDKYADVTLGKTQVRRACSVKTLPSGSWDEPPAGLLEFGCVPPALSPPAIPNSPRSQRSPTCQGP